MDRGADGDLSLRDPEADRRMAATPSLWRYLPQLALYPLRGYALGVVLVLGTAFMLVAKAGLFGIAAGAILMGWFGFYLLDVVGETALGHARPPPLGTEVFSQFEFGRILLLFAYVLGLVLTPAYFAAFRHNHAAAWLVAAMLFLLPAFIAQLALEDDLLSILNPAKLGYFILITGPAYVGVCVLMAAAGALNVLLAGHVAAVLTHMLTLYCLIFTCHLLGYTAYHHHEKLGMAVAVPKPTDETRRAETQRTALEARLTRLDAFAGQEQWQAAVALVLAPERAVNDARLFYEELFEALVTRRQPALALAAGTRLMEILAQQQRFLRALDIYALCLDLSAQFEPNVNLCVLLAETALREHRLPLFERIVCEVPPRHPGTEAAISLQFLHARYLAETRHDDAAALALLAPLRSAGHHPLHARIQALYRALGGVEPEA